MIFLGSLVFRISEGVWFFVSLKVHEDERPPEGGFVDSPPEGGANQD